MKITDISIDLCGIFLMALIIWCWATARIDVWVAMLFILSRFSAKFKHTCRRYTK